MKRFTILAALFLGLSTQVFAQNVFDVVFGIPSAVHLFPLTVVHEGSHWLTYKAGGTSASLNLLPSFQKDDSGKKHFVLGYVQASEWTSDAHDALVSIAPYVTRLLVVDRTMEALYRNHTIKEGSFMDKYMSTNLYMTILDPIMQAGEGADLQQFCENIGVPRAAVVVPLQAAYIYSFIRVMKAGNRQNAWIFYIKLPLR